MLYIFFVGPNSSKITVSLNVYLQLWVTHVGVSISFKVFSSCIYGKGFPQPNIRRVNEGLRPTVFCTQRMQGKANPSPFATFPHLKNSLYPFIAGLMEVFNRMMAKPGFDLTVFWQLSAQ